MKCYTRIFAILIMLSTSRAYCMEAEISAAIERMRSSEPVDPRVFPGSSRYILQNYKPTDAFCTDIMRLIKEHRVTEQSLPIRIFRFIQYMRTIPLATRDLIDRYRMRVEALASLLPPATESNRSLDRPTYNDELASILQALHKAREWII